MLREPGCTSLAEACERTTLLIRRALGTEHVRFLTSDHDVKAAHLDDPAIAYIKLTHVEPFCGSDDNGDSGGDGGDCDTSENFDFDAHTQSAALPEMNFDLHTNRRIFFYEKPILEPLDADAAAETGEKMSEQARLSLERVFLIGKPMAQKRKHTNKYLQR